MVRLADAVSANNAADCTGKTALVVGGTSGCGKGLALVLARQGCTVVIIGRNVDRGAIAAREIQTASPTNLECKFISCDVRSFAEIKKTCSELSAAHPRIDFISVSSTRGPSARHIAGITPTDEGFDERLMMMYLGRWAWVHALLPNLNRSDDPRVISILSAGKHSSHKHWETDFLTAKCSVSGRTFACGFYNDCACEALCKLQPKLTAVHIFPGFVNTNWWMELPWGMRCLTKLLMRTAKSVEDCGEWMAYPLLNPKFASGPFACTEHAEPEQWTKLQSTACEGVWAKSVQVFERHLG